MRIFDSSGMSLLGYGLPLPAKLSNLGRLDRLVSSTALGVEEPEQLLQHRSIGAVTQEGALAAHRDEILILELLQVMRQSGGCNAQFVLNFANHHPIRVRGEERPQNPQPRLRPESGKHIRICGRAVGIESKFQS